MARGPSATVRQYLTACEDLDGCIGPATAGSITSLHSSGSNVSEWIKKDIDSLLSLGSGLMAIDEYADVSEHADPAVGTSADLIPFEREERVPYIRDTFGGVMMEAIDSMSSEYHSDDRLGLEYLQGDFELGTTDDISLKTYDEEEFEDDASLVCEKAEAEEDASPTQVIGFVTKETLEKYMLPVTPRLLALPPIKVSRTIRQTCVDTAEDVHPCPVTPRAPRDDVRFMCDTPREEHFYKHWKC